MIRPLLLLTPLLFASCEKIQEALKSGSEEASATAGAGGHATDLGEGDFDAFIRRPNQVVVVDFHATWCGPCRTLGPKLEQVAGEFGEGVALGKVDVDQANAIAARYQVQGIPDVRIFVNGRQVDQFVGDIPERTIREKIAPWIGKAASTSAPADLESGAPAAGGEGAQPSIQPMQKDWLPPGMEKK